MPNLIWEPFDPESPLQGPIKPVACIEGWASHRWELTIEESTVHLIAKCRLCTDGLRAFRDDEWPVELAIPMHVDLELIDDSYADNINLWVQLTPTKGSS